MERNFRFTQNQFVNTLPRIRRIEKKDFSEYDLSRIMELNVNDVLNVFRKERFKEYKDLKFPVWKRSKLEGLEIKDLDHNIKYKKVGKVWEISDLDGEGFDILSKMDFEGSDRKYVLMADAFFTDGFYFIANQEKNEAQLKLEIKEAFRIENNVLNLKEGSESTLLRFVKMKDSTFVSNVRIKAKRNSKLKFINVIICEDSTCIDNIFLEGNNNSEVEIYDVRIGGNPNVSYILSKLVGNGSKSKVNPLYLASDSEIIDLMFILRTIGEESVGKIVGRGALNDKGKVVIRSTGDIMKGAKEASIKEDFYTLVLSDKAKIEEIPALWVSENEVNASHSATSGAISEDVMYYFNTRAISENEAKLILVLGLFEEAQNFISDDALKESIVQSITKRTVFVRK